MQFISWQKNVITSLFSPVNPNHEACMQENGLHIFDICKPKRYYITFNFNFIFFWSTYTWWQSILFLIYSSMQSLPSLGGGTLVATKMQFSGDGRRLICNENCKPVFIYDLSTTKNLEGTDKVLLCKDFKESKPMLFCWKRRRTSRLLARRVCLYLAVASCRWERRKDYWLDSAGVHSNVHFSTICFNNNNGVFALCDLDGIVKTSNEISPSDWRTVVWRWNLLFPFIHVSYHQK